MMEMVIDGRMVVKFGSDASVIKGGSDGQI
jgi:hypothetical protein